MKVALVHDWLNGMRGGEKVLEVLCELYPQADIFTLIYEPDKISEIIKQHRITTSFVQHLPWARKHYRNYLPLFPTAVEQFDLRGYDLVVSSSHCVAKGVITEPATLHVCYCHTPMRYAWEQYYEYFPAHRLGWFSRRLIPLAMNYLRAWDAASSQRVDDFISNSHHVAARIRKYYGREAIVVHPPVSARQFTPSPRNRDYYLVVSALVPYKRIDRAIVACNQLQAPLVVVGSGPEEKNLHKIAGKTIRFVPQCETEQLRDYYAECKAFLFPGEEDFGITPLEAMASGRPVIAFGKGGVLETVVSGKTGVFFQESTPEAMAKAMKAAGKIRWNPRLIRQHALAFDRGIFKQKMKQTLEGMLRDWKKGK